MDNTFLPKKQLRKKLWLKARAFRVFMQEFLLETTLMNGGELL